jgi:hypothetical protein
MLSNIVITIEVARISDIMSFTMTTSNNKKRGGFNPNPMVLLVLLLLLRRCCGVVVLWLWLGWCVVVDRIGGGWGVDRIGSGEEFNL